MSMKRKRRVTEQRLDRMAKVADGLDEEEETAGSCPKCQGKMVGRKVEMSVVEYLDTQMKRSIDWDDAAAMVEERGGPFAVKGVMSVEDARRCVDIGASALMISNHGGRQLDGSRSPFDQLPAILDAVGGEIEVIVDGGIRRGTHVLKAMAMLVRTVSIKSS